MEGGWTGSRSPTAMKRLLLYDNAAQPVAAEVLKEAEEMTTEDDRLPGMRDPITLGTPTLLRS